MRNFLGRKIFFDRIRDLAFCIILFIIILIYAFMQFKEVIPGLSSVKQAITESDVISAYNNGQSKRISISVNKENILIVHNKVASTGEIQNIYSLIPMDGKYILVYAPKNFYKVNSEKENWNFVGTVTQYDGEAKLAINDAQKTRGLSAEQTKKIIIPYSVDCTITTGGSINTVVFLIVGIIVFTIMLLFAIYRVIQPKQKEIANKTEGYGSFDSIMASINQEMSEKILCKSNKMRMTKSWIVYRNTHRELISIIMLDKVVRVQHYKILNWKYWGNILIIKDCLGNSFDIRLFSKRKANCMLNYLRETYPQIEITENIK